MSLTLPVEHIIGSSSKQNELCAHKNALVEKV